MNTKSNVTNKKSVNVGLIIVVCLIVGTFIACWLADMQSFAKKSAELKPLPELYKDPKVKLQPAGGWVDEWETGGMNYKMVRVGQGSQVINVTKDSLEARWYGNHINR